MFCKWNVIHPYLSPQLSLMAYSFLGELSIEIASQSIEGRYVPFGQDVHWDGMARCWLVVAFGWSLATLVSIILLGMFQMALKLMGTLN